MLEFATYALESHKGLLHQRHFDQMLGGDEPRRVPSACYFKGHLPVMRGRPFQFTHCVWNFG